MVAIFLRRSVVLAAVLLGTAGLAAPAAGWTPKSHRVIAASAARFAPPDLHRQITRNREAYLLGVEDPFRDGFPAGHEENPGGGKLDEAIVLAVDNAIRTIEAQRPFNEICYRLGVVAHFLADANNPLAVADRDPNEPRYAADFLSYLESTEPRLRTTFYGFRAGFDGRRDLPELLEETLRRGREHYDLVAREYQRIGYRSGLGGFSDRSTAFGVASLSYSHAVSDIAEVLRYIWLASGGIDSRPTLPARGKEIVVLPLDPAVR